jgi:archaellum component FlaC
MYLEFIRTRDQRKRIEERIDRMEKEIQELKTMVESLVNRSSGENK